MNSQVNSLLHVLREGFIRDLIATYPALKVGFLKDFERIALGCRNRGLGIFTLDLPELESSLLKGLESGRLVPLGPLSTRVSKKIRVPRLFSGLWLRVFDKSACLKQEVDVTALAFLRSLLTIGKKLEVGCSNRRLLSAVKAYHDIESSLSRPSLNWDQDFLGYRGESLYRSNPRHLCNGDRDSFGLYYCDPRLFARSSFHEERLLRRRSKWGTDNDIDLSSLSLTDFEPKSLEDDLFNDLPTPQLGDRYLLSQIQRVADLIATKIGTFCPDFHQAWCQWTDNGIGFKHGPGAVSEHQKQWEKSHFPSWSDKLQGVFPFEKFGKTSFSEDERPLRNERPSRLIAVPKTSKGPRLIAAEPTSHMWCQQAILSFLYHRCDEFLVDFIDFKDQEKSGSLVLQASLDRSLATVDLSDASDRLTCRTVERIFRSNPSLLSALHAARTRYIRDDISVVPGFLKLKKFASQGTATTFPIMSITMLCIALGSTLNGNITWKKILGLRNRVRVFGDDIIIPSHGYGRLLRALELLELKANVAKSYVRGHFRESCGVDGYMGYDVTPCKPKRIVADGPASCQAVVDTTTNLFYKGYWNASTACERLLPQRLSRRLRIVAAHDAGFVGLPSYSGSYEHHLDTRWNQSLHRYEVRVFALRESSKKRPNNFDTALLDFVSSKYSPCSARTVSEYTDRRKTVAGLRWEPQNSSDRLCHEGPGGLRTVEKPYRNLRTGSGRV